eukprot:TRINITY_DN19006_c0_g1_i1.p1 TRINITY_DN19006_c0_g1~~TRINITY_DN19006_c0_g1_i1.p1  ORF type:complete len:232 (-),score=40.14 TRINITY_DN19006_c0_g1_i1:146-841(-)
MGTVPRRGLHSNEQSHQIFCETVSVPLFQKSSVHGDAESLLDSGHLAKDASHGEKRGDLTVQLRDYVIRDRVCQEKKFDHDACNAASATRVDSVQPRATVRRAQYESFRDLWRKSIGEEEEEEEEISSFTTSFVEQSFPRCSVSMWTVGVSGSTSHSVQRRYREFVALDHVVRRTYPSLPKLPPKSIFWKHVSRRFMDDRQRKLAAFVNALLVTDPTLSDPNLREFFGVDR